MMNTSDRAIGFSHDELMSLCKAYITHTTIHRVELATIFTQYFPSCEEPYLLEDIRNIYENNGLYNTYIFKRCGFDLMSATEIKKFLSNGFSKESAAVIKDLYTKRVLIDPAFGHILSENRYEFDIIPEVMNSIYIFTADLILRSFVQCNITLLSFNGLAKLDPAVYRDLKFFFNSYVGGIGNKKDIVGKIKTRYMQITTFNLQEKDKIARLYLVGGTDLLLVKHHIIRFYLDYYDEFKSFKEWHEKVEAVIITYMSVLLPKMQYLFNRIDAKEIQDKVEELAKFVEWSFNAIHKRGVLRKQVLEFDAKSKQKVFDHGFDICDPEHCDDFHKNKNEFQKRPELHFVIAECNQLRKSRLENLREYFALGSFKKQSAFAKFLKESLNPLTDKADLFFEHEGGFKQLSDIYHRGLLRFFWKHENLKQIKDYYEELSRYIQDEGVERLFHKDGDIVRIKFDALDKKGWWVEPLLYFEYQPARSKDNYSKLIETLFNNREFVRIGEREISVHIIVFLIMFYYWIYLSLDGEASDEIRLWSRCVFHKEIPEKW